MGKSDQSGQDQGRIDFRELPNGPVRNVEVKQGESSCSGVENDSGARAVIRMPGEGKEVRLAGGPMMFLVTGEDTRQTSIFYFTLRSGCSTGLHVHRVHEETLYVLEGECEWQVGSQLVRAKPGTFVFIPPNMPHNIANATDKPTKVLLTVSPSGFENYFKELEQLIADGGPPDPAAMAELRSRYHTEQLSAPSANYSSVLALTQGGPS